MSSLSTIDKAIHMLKTKQKGTVKVSSISEFINLIAAINKMEIQAFYRGQSSADWDIVSAAYRKLRDGSHTEPSPRDIEEYQRYLLSTARMLNDTETRDYSDISLLTHLQHHSANTNFIDFTTSPLVALWFACEGTRERDGAIYWIVRDTEMVNIGDNVTESFSGDGDDLTLFRLAPQFIDKRVMVQQGLFIFNVSGKIDSYNVRKIIIKKEQKPLFLDHLRQVGVSGRSLFPDTHGMKGWFRFDGAEYISIIFNEAVMISKRDRKLAIDKCLKALEYANIHYGAEDIRTAKILWKIGSLYNAMGTPNESIKYHKRALGIRIKELGIDHIETSDSYNSLAILHRKQDEYSRAIELYGEALRIRRKIYGEKHRGIATIYNNLGVLYEKIWNPGEALKYHKKCLDIRMYLYNDEKHRSVLISKSNTARVERLKGNYGRAETLAKDVLNARIEKFGTEDGRVTISYILYASIIRERKAYDEAIDLILNALKIRLARDGENSADVNDCYMELAITYLARNKDLADINKAYENINKAYDFYQKEYGEAKSILGKILYYQGKIELLRGNEEEALSVLLKAYNINLRLFGSDAPPIINVKKEIMKFYSNACESMDFEQWISKKNEEISHI